MRVFQHIIGDFVCAKGCGGSVQVPVGVGTWLHRPAAIVASVVWYAGKFREWMPWYHILTIFCFEMLLMYLIGILRAVWRIGRGGGVYPRCPQCGGETSLNGRYYMDDPAGFPSPWPSALIHLAVFTGINVVLWIMWGEPLR